MSVSDILRSGGGEAPPQTIVRTMYLEKRWTRESRALAGFVLSLCSSEFTLASCESILDTYIYAGDRRHT